MAVPYTSPKCAAKIVTGILWISISLSAADLLGAATGSGANAITAALIPLISIAAGISFIIWFKLVRANLSALGATELQERSFWCFWGFFVPILSLYKPLLVAQEIFRASDPEVVHATAWKEGRKSLAIA